MICLIFFAICFLASATGAICGIGGGVIIKPVLDAFGILDVNVISFLSGCTVLSMTTYSVVRSRMSRESHVETAVGLPLALGSGPEAAVLGALGLPPAGSVVICFLCQVGSTPHRKKLRPPGTTPPSGA